LGGFSYLPASGSNGKYKVTYNPGADYPTGVKVVYLSKEKLEPLTLETAPQSNTDADKANSIGDIAEFLGLTIGENGTATAEEQIANYYEYANDTFEEEYKVNVDEWEAAGISKQNALYPYLCEHISGHNVLMTDEIGSENNADYDTFTNYTELITALPSYVDKSDYVGLKRGDGSKQIKQYHAIRFFNTNGSEVDSYKIIKHEANDGYPEYSSLEFNTDITSILMETFWVADEGIWRQRQVLCQAGTKRSPLAAGGSAAVCNSSSSPKITNKSSRVTGQQIKVNPVEYGGAFGVSGDTYKSLLWYGASTGASVGASAFDAKYQSASLVNQSWATTGAGFVGASGYVATSGPSYNASLLEQAASNTDKMRSNLLEMYKHAEEDTTRGSYFKSQIKHLLQDLGEADTNLRTAQDFDDYTSETCLALDSGSLAASFTGPIGSGTSMVLGAGSNGLKVYNDRKCSKALKEYNKTIDPYQALCLAYNKSYDKMYHPASDDPDARMTPIHDPSGYVYEGVLSNPVEGATVTLYTDGNHRTYVPEYEYSVDSETGAKTATLKEGYSSVTGDSPLEADMAELGQDNPLISDSEGHYSWMVPEGLWFVEAFKEGYYRGSSNNDKAALVTGDSTYTDSTGGSAARKWLPVLPPQLEVHIPLLDYTPPTVSGNVLFKTDGIYLAFNKYMDLDSLRQNLKLMDSTGAEIAGAIEFLDEESAPDNIDYGGETPSYARRIRIRPGSAESLTPGSQYSLSVNAAASSYAQISMGKARVFSGSVSKKEKLAGPAFDKNSGRLAQNSRVTIALPDSAPEGTKIIYTTDGSEPDESTGKRCSSPVTVVMDASPDTTMTIKAIAVLDGYESSSSSASYEIYDDFVLAEAETVTEEEKTEEKKEEVSPYKTETVTVGDDSFVITWTASVSYNGKKHIETNKAGSKSKENDITVEVKKNGEILSASVYKVKFKNNKFVTGYNRKPAPTFSLSFKGKAYKEAKKAFKKKTFEFDIMPCTLTEDNVVVKKVLLKNGKLKFSGLKYNNGQKKFSLKASKGNKGDYTAEISADGKSAIITGVNNFFSSVTLTITQGAGSPG
nr:chitobiase/beta-hexosaminidase C-terminal domain-containing protein [Lachnospiraceae bacterium]